MTNPKINMKEINEIKSQMGQLRQKLTAAKKRLEQAGLKALGLSVGDVIKTKKGLVHVTGCEAVSHWVWPVGLKVKKDGTVGQQSAGHIGDEWERVQ